jgi:hypothetical protein
MNLGKLLRNHWDRSVAVACLVLGLIALYLGWQGVSDHTLATEQLPYIVSGAVFGLFLLGVAATLWLSADLRDTWQALRQVHDDLSADADDDAVPADLDGGSRQVIAQPIAEDAPPADGPPARSRRRQVQVHAG